MTTRAVPLLALTLLLCSCAATPRKTAVQERDVFTLASSKLAARIPGDTKVAIATPISTVRHPFGSFKREIKSNLEERAKGYPLRLEGALAEALRAPVGKSSASVLTRTHLEPILEEHELQWRLLASDQETRVQLAKLTEVDVLITWNLSLERPQRVGYGDWNYEEQWVLQALNIESGELLGSVTLHRPIHWTDGRRP